LIKPLLSAKDQEVFDGYATLLSKETDRGAAVLAGGYLDALLEDLLRAVLVLGPKLDDLISTGRPLGSFSSRIDLAYSLGLLPEVRLRDLHLIRKIRNYFAHDMEADTFAMSPVCDWCRELASTTWALSISDPASLFRNDFRGQFILAVQFAMFHINKAKYSAQRCSVPA
jgi:DNA-binding MltR family transcriptional regulator